LSASVDNDGSHLGTDSGVERGGIKERSDDSHIDSLSLNSSREDLGETIDDRLTALNLLSLAESDTRLNSGLINISIAHTHQKLSASEAIRCSLEVTVVDELNNLLLEVGSSLTHLSSVVVEEGQGELEHSQTN